MLLLSALFFLLNLVVKRTYGNVFRVSLFVAEEEEEVNPVVELLLCFAKKQKAKPKFTTRLGPNHEQH